MICIVDYKAGNLTSVKLAFDALNVDAFISSKPEDVAGAERIVFPGVGAAGAAMDELNRCELSDALKAAVSNGIPFLGICVGTQILFDYSEEDGGTDCLGLVPGQVRRFQATNHYDKIPQMGWNTVSCVKEHPVFAGVEKDTEFYFVHSYYPAPSNQQHCIAQTTYADETFASVLGYDNLLATQFHCEKSGRPGLQLLKNFSEWDGTC
ncbi:MAG: imidazole glycerol phosphate synthase subunit HisH [Lentisphaeria bacterium]|nr:imidazole glycerol phosphate synthase subunit HisH [Lentisphaeria bacterium]NQZ67870.1 imidazole glycerol phosphate synthase subunit HisH [Lentisphaeria bacterium]